MNSGNDRAVVVGDDLGGDDPSQQQSDCEAANEPRLVRARPGRQVLPTTMNIQSLFAACGAPTTSNAQLPAAAPSRSDGETARRIMPPRAPVTRRSPARGHRRSLTSKLPWCSARRSQGSVKRSLAPTPTAACRAAYPSHRASRRRKSTWTSTPGASSVAASRCSTTR